MELNGLCLEWCRFYWLLNTMIKTPAKPTNIRIIPNMIIKSEFYCSLIIDWDS